MRWAIVVALALVAGVAEAQLYEWLDERGERHFADDLNRVPDRHRRQMSVSPWERNVIRAVPAAGAPDGAGESARGLLARAVMEAGRECETRFPGIGRVRVDPDGSLWLTGQTSDQSARNSAFLQCYREQVRDKRFAARPLCFDGAVAVESPWNDTVRRLHDKMKRTVSDELGAKEVSITVVDGPSTLPSGGTCGSGRRASVVFSLNALRSLRAYRDAEWPIARILAHEFAHIVLHQNSADSLHEHDQAVREYEADELGVYYFERAGYDCREWVNGVGPLVLARYDTAENQRSALRIACDLARRGQRPPRRIAGP